MAENIDVNVNVNTNQANRNLDNLNNKIGVLNRSFTAFKTVLGGLAIGSFVSGTLRFADSIQDLADSTGIATANILGFSNAVAQNGGTADNAQIAIQKLVQSIGEAADGSLKTQQAFKDVGVTLQDLRTLSEQDILLKTVNGLGKINDAGKRAVVQTELLGKSLRGVNITGVAQGLEQATAESQQYAAAIKSAADTQQALDTTLNNLKIALLDVLKPIADVAKEFTASIETIKNLLKALLALGAAVATMTLLGRIVAIVAGSLRLLAGAAEAVQAGMFNISIRMGNLGKIGQFLSDKIAALGIWFSNLISKSPKLAQSLEYIAAAFTPLIGIITGVITAFKLFDKETALTGKEAADAIAKMNEESMKAHAESNRRLEQEQANRRIVIDGLAKQTREIQNVSVAYKEQNAEVLRGLDLQKEQLTTSADDYELQTALIDNSERLRKSLEDLQKQKEAAAADPEKSSLVAVYDQEMNKIRESAAVNHDAIIQKITDIQSLKNEQDILVKQQELIKQQLTDDAAIKALQDQLALIGLFGDELENANIALEVSAALEQRLLQLREMEIDLITRKGQLTDEQFNREMAQIEALRQAAYAKAGAEIDLKTQTQQAQKASDEDAKKGIDKYIDELEKSVTPAKVALNSVQTVFSGINNALDNFVQTGKFKFKDFALSIIRDLLLIQAKAAATQIFTSILKGLKIPFLAEGGPATANKPYIVGEKGPELFVPKQSGTVIPNDQMGRGSGMVNAPVTNNYITNNINALDAKSVAQLFAENRKTLLGVTETARREMAYGS